MEVGFPPVEEIAWMKMSRNWGLFFLGCAILNEILWRNFSFDEWLKMKKHPESGFRILSSVPEYLEIAAIVLAHHERFDGTGYPNKVKGHDIHLASRIICLADAYDAMTETRTYRSAMTKEEAIEEIKRCSGSQFDPEIVQIFLDKIVDKI